MAARIIDGKGIAAAIRERMSADVSAIKENGVTPGLAAVLVGDDPASQVYVGAKEKQAQAMGMISRVDRLAISASQSELLETIGRLNEDSSIHGIIVQLPLPEHMDAIQAQEAVSPKKDVDGLHPENAGLLALGRPRFVPCTPQGVMSLLEAEGVEVAGAEAVVVGRSNLVGRPLSILLSGRGANATVTLCHTGTADAAFHTARADILVAATGAAGSITGEMIKPGAVVIDVGITRGEGGLVGDVEFKSAAQVAGAITPVPGGVGPMTVAMLLRNTLLAAQRAAQA